MSGADERRRDLERRASAGEPDAMYDLAVLEEESDGNAAFLNRVLRAMLLKAKGQAGATRPGDMTLEDVASWLLEQVRRSRAGVRHDAWTSDGDRTGLFWATYVAAVVDVDSDKVVVGIGSGPNLASGPSLRSVWPEVFHPVDWRGWLKAEAVNDGGAIGRALGGPPPVEILAEYRADPGPFGFTLTAEERARAGRGRVRVSVGLAVRWCMLVGRGHFGARNPGQVRNDGPDERLRALHRAALAGGEAEEAAYAAALEDAGLLDARFDELRAAAKAEFDVHENLILNVEEVLWVSLDHGSGGWVPFGKKGGETGLVSVDAFDDDPMMEGGRLQAKWDVTLASDSPVPKPRLWRGHDDLYVNGSTFWVSGKVERPEWHKLNREIDRDWFDAMRAIDAGDRGAGRTVAAILEREGVWPEAIKREVRLRLRARPRVAAPALGNFEEMLGRVQDPAEFARFTLQHRLSLRGRAQQAAVVAAERAHEAYAKFGLDLIRLSGL